MCIKSGAQLYASRQRGLSRPNRLGALALTSQLYAWPGSSSQLVYETTVWPHPAGSNSSWVARPTVAHHPAVVPSAQQLFVVRLGPSACCPITRRATTALCRSTKVAHHPAVVRSSSLVWPHHPAGNNSSLSFDYGCPPGGRLPNHLHQHSRTGVRGRVCETKPSYRSPVWRPVIRAKARYSGHRRSRATPRQCRWQSRQTLCRSTRTERYGLVPSLGGSAWADS